MKPASAPPSHEPVLTPAALSRFGLPALLLLTILAYLNSFAGVWQFDDHAVLLADPRVQSLSAWWQSLPHIRPLFKLSVAINHELGWGLPGFHLVNLLLHLANTALLHQLLLRLLTGQSQARFTPWPVWFITAVFALHPAQTEVVTYLSGRSVALEAFGLLFSCYALLRYQQSAPSSLRWPWLMLMAFAVVLALASRESAVIAPLLLGWLALCGRDWQAEPESSRRLMIVAMLAALLLLIAVLLLPRYRDLLWLALQWRDLETLVATQSQAIAHLLAVAGGLAPLNADPALLVAPLISLRGATAMALLIVLSVATWRRRVRQPLAVLAFGCLLIIWLPTHSIFVRLDPVNDRQLYLALPAILALALLLLAPLGVGIARVLPRASLRHQQILQVGVLLCIAALATATALRNRIYFDESTYWRDVVDKAPHNARAWNNLGMALAMAGQRTDAEAAFLKALQRRPDYRKAAVNLRLLQAGRLPQ